MANEDIIKEFATTKNLLVLAFLGGVYGGSRMPGYFERKVEELGREIGQNISAGMAQGATYKPISGASGASGKITLEDVYKMSANVLERQTELLGVLSRYAPQAEQTRA